MALTHFERLLIATGNKGKIAELRDLLQPLRLPLITLADIPRIAEPEETGTTFDENAAIKAAFYARMSGEWAIADDSGLEIDQLDGAPGVYSARFGGEGSSYQEKMALVLSKLQNARSDQRSARFVCVIKVADPTGRIAISANGVCEGLIANSPRGSNGFGYDPIFIAYGSEMTFGELSDIEKRSISHRGKASADLIRKMLDFTGV
jgi:XTP/dITP diphosphohydrolase